MLPWGIRAARRSKEGKYTVAQMKDAIEDLQFSTASELLCGGLTPDGLLASTEIKGGASR